MREYLIEVRSCLKGLHDEENLEITTVGSFSGQADRYHIAYDETPGSGMEGAVTSLTVDGADTITLERTGSTNMRMILEKGQRHLCHYDTGFGDLMVGVFTEDIHSNLGHDGGELNFKYSVDINSEFSSDTEVFITVKEAGFHA